MSDAVQLAIISGVFSLATLVVTHMINKSTRRRMDGVGNKVDVVEKKLDENHRLTNGHMDNLLKTTKALGEEIGKQKEKDNPS
jgi:hypothetical protein